MSMDRLTKTSEKGGLAVDGMEDAIAAWNRRANDEK